MYRRQTQHVIRTFAELNIFMLYMFLCLIIYIAGDTMKIQGIIQ